MNGLPANLPPDDGEAFTGLVCPDCSGNLVLQRQAEYVSFTCRVGHAYSIAELVASKETVIEARMWATVFVFEEMQALLEGLEHHALTDGLDGDACRDRAALAERQAGRLRAIFQDDRPLVTADGEVGGWRTRHDQRGSDRA